MAKRTTRGSAPAPSGFQTGDDSRRILEAYLFELKAIRATGAGVPETSYYPALANLFNAVGKTLKPRVRCIINISNQGAGLPDGGLFTADQFQRQADGEPKPGQLPARGAIEAKGTKRDVKAIVGSQQVKEYLKTYGIVLVTNLREFVIVDRGPTGEPIQREAFALADEEQGFWQDKAAHPRSTAQLLGEPFIEFIKRACLHAAPLSNPKDVAWFLASYARDALFRVERQKELPALQAVRAALEEALGMKFTAERGEHFFRSTLVQTLFYGVFSAWVRWHKDNPGAKAKFDWRTAEWSLHVPFIRTLYEEVAKPSRLGPLGLVEALDWSAGVLNRVDRAEFFKSFEDEHAVQYFYEPFLEAYDPELRKALGVWYTPPEIVKYQVARVDAVLREELDLPDGLADPNVIVLDPCCGTGAYLVEALHRIAATLRDKGGDALVASDLKQAAINRVFGFEIMPAPFVVSHLQLGLMLQAQGAPLSQTKGERVGVYLTNALTGWEPPKGPKQQVMAWAELQQERDAAEHVKRDKKILVVLGNPPYNGFAGVAVDEERALTTAYRTTRKAPSPEGQGLNDLYVRFYRMAERRITEMSGQGIVCFISNYSWLDGRSHTGMRERFIEAFDHIWIDCLNGDKYKTGKLTPDGKPDPSVFSTPHNREGIQVGTAIVLLARRPDHRDDAEVQFRDFWGAGKLQALRQTALQHPQLGYARINPHLTSGLVLIPSVAEAEYFGWPRINELLPVSFPGIKTSRDDLLVDIDRSVLEGRMRAYFDPHVGDEDMAALCPVAMRNAARFDAKATRRCLQARGMSQTGLRRYCYRPFDLRWLYWEHETKLLDEKRAEYVAHSGAENVWLAAVQHNRKSFDPPIVTIHLCSLHVIERGANLFPLLLKTCDDKEGTLLPVESTRPNLSDKAVDALRTLGFSDLVIAARRLFFHAVAILYAPQYGRDNASPLRQDWPRIPLPADRKALEASAALGEQVAALLDTEAEVPGVTSGKIAPLLRTIGLITKTGGGAIDPSADDLAITAGWGHYGKEGVVMPAKGKLCERQYDEGEAKALDAEAAARGMTAAELRRLLGEQTLDVYLNGVAYWRNIPAGVWEYYIGGYQVIKKWLSYREHEILGRALKPDEAREVMNTARRIAAIILLQPKLDENYRKVKAATFDWPGKA